MPIRTPAGPAALRSSLAAGLLLVAILLPACTGSTESDDVAAVKTKRPAMRAAAPSKPLPVTPPPADGEPTVRGSLEVMPGRLDLGFVSPQSTHPLEFTLRNLGDDDITIVVTKPTCLCTTLDDLSGQVIPPGGTLPLKATFNAPTELGEKHAKVQVIFSENGVEDRALIGFGGTIAMELQPDPPYVDALKSVTSGEITLASTDGRTFRVLSADGRAPVFADGFDNETDTPRSSYRLRWNVPARSTENCSGMRLWWIVETDDATCPIIPVRVRHECTGGRSDPMRRRRGWVFSEQIVALGAIAAGEPVEVSVKLSEMPNSQGAPGEANITSVRSSTGGSRAELLSVDRIDEKHVTCRLRITPDAQMRGMMYDMVRFDSPTGSHDVAVVARVN